MNLNITGKDFDLTDRISIILEESCPYKQELINNERYICEEVLSDKIDFVNSLPISEEIEINEVNFKVNINKIWNLKFEIWNTNKETFKS